jgi:hypothetical protein
VDHPVTLTDVAVLAARLAGAEDFLAMSEGLFTPERRMPVLAMLEDMLFEPASGRQWRQAQLLQPLPAEFVLPLSMQRALMQQARSADP